MNRHIEIQCDDISKVTMFSLQKALFEQSIAPLHQRLLALIPRLEGDGIFDMTEGFRALIAETLPDLRLEVGAVWAMRFPRESCSGCSAAGRLRNLLAGSATRTWVVGRQRHELVSNLEQHEQLEDAVYLVAIDDHDALDKLLGSLRQTTLFDLDGFVTESSELFSEARVEAPSVPESIPDKPPDFGYGNMIDALEKEQMPSKYARRLVYDDSLAVMITSEAELAGIKIRGRRARDHLRRRGETISTGVMHELEIDGEQALAYLLDHPEVSREAQHYMIEHVSPGRGVNTVQSLKITRVVLELAVRKDRGPD